MYIQLPDYDDFQGYDLGFGGILSQIGHKIYANFHKSAWRTLKHHLFLAKITKKLFKDSKLFKKTIRMAISHMEACLGVAKIPIANTSNELVEMDFW